jgi:hypothetical protein
VVAARLGEAGEAKATVSSRTSQRLPTATMLPPKKTATLRTMTLARSAPAVTDWVCGPASGASAPASWPWLGSPMLTIRIRRDPLVKPWGPRNDETVRTRRSFSAKLIRVAWSRSWEQVSVACPACGQAQIVPTANLQHMLSCPRCGAANLAGALIPAPTPIQAMQVQGVPLPPLVPPVPVPPSSPTAASSGAPGAALAVAWQAPTPHTERTSDNAHAARRGG